MSTYSAKPGEVKRDWYVLDAKDQVLGRLAVKVAQVLRGKLKPTFTPHVDAGDFVIVVNASQVRVTGAKTTDKIYRHHSFFPGGLKEIPFEKLLEKQPDRVIRLAVRGMLPKNKLGRKLLKKLKIYATAEHPHQAQQPQPLAL